MAKKQGKKRGKHSREASGKDKASKIKKIRNYLSKNKRKTPKMPEKTKKSIWSFFK